MSDDQERTPVRPVLEFEDEDTRHQRLGQCAWHMPLGSSFNSLCRGVYAQARLEQAAGSRN